ncbi:hypothetical protein FISHEDRAFT_76812 [Fistulina hepatica ATCC 64428]|uniref:Uncharacterized protein n=1 Tax=Fistulina hepatica ATCC 64428 TaxID=1128425 RepID=A0A0D7A316_9AGAR|nr:hypothetical protein FISHEDRAFT_76812 [Fistulina hepatica ATCC 64428]
MSRGRFTPDSSSAPVQALGVSVALHRITTEAPGTRLPHPTLLHLLPSSLKEESNVLHQLEWHWGLRKGEIDLEASYNRINDCIMKARWNERRWALIPQSQVIAGLALVSKHNSTSTVDNRVIRSESPYQEHEYDFLPLNIREPLYCQWDDGNHTRYDYPYTGFPRVRCTGHPFFVTHALQDMLLNSRAARSSLDAARYAPIMEMDRLWHCHPPREFLEGVPVWALHRYPYSGDGDDALRALKCALIPRTQIAAVPSVLKTRPVHLTQPQQLPSPPPSPRSRQTSLNAHASSSAQSRPHPLKRSLVAQLECLQRPARERIEQWLPTIEHGVNPDEAGTDIASPRPMRPASLASLFAGPSLSPEVTPLSPRLSSHACRSSTHQSLAHVPAPLTPQMESDDTSVQELTKGKVDERSRHPLVVLADGQSFKRRRRWRNPRAPGEDASRYCSNDWAFVKHEVRLWQNDDIPAVACADSSSSRKRKRMPEV